MHSLGRLDGSHALVTAYQNCCAVIVPSRFEGFGLTALEAMACGTPVVASDTSGLREVLAKGNAGVLCPPGSVDAFVRAIRELCENSVVENTRGMSGRERALECYSEARVIPEYTSLYERLLAG